MNKSEEPDAELPRAGISHSELRKIEHDLRGPLVTARGFIEELQVVENELKEWLDSVGNSLSDSQRADLARMLEDDISPCVMCAASALNQLDERLSMLIANVDRAA